MKKKMFLTVLSLLVIMMFLVGCSDLAGEAIRIKKATGAEPPTPEPVDLPFNKITITSYAICGEGHNPLSATEKLNSYATGGKGTPVFLKGDTEYIVSTPLSPSKEVELVSVFKDGTKWYACGNLIS